VCGLLKEMMAAVGRMGGRRNWRRRERERERRGKTVFVLI